MEHNHFEHCLQGWPTLLALLAVASLGSAGFIALLGGVGWLLSIRQQSVTPIALPVVATTAEVTTSRVVAGVNQADAGWRRPPGRSPWVTGSGAVPAIRWGRSVRHVRGERPGEDAWTATRWVHLTGHAAKARRRAPFRGRVRRRLREVPRRSWPGPQLNCPGRGVPCKYFAFVSPDLSEEELEAECGAKLDIDEANISVVVDDTMCKGVEPWGWHGIRPINEKVARDGHLLVVSRKMAQDLLKVIGQKPYEYHLAILEGDASLAGLWVFNDDFTHERVLGGIAAVDPALIKIEAVEAYLRGKPLGEQRAAAARTAHEQVGRATVPLVRAEVSSARACLSIRRTER